MLPFVNMAPLAPAAPRQFHGRGPNRARALPERPAGRTEQPPKDMAEGPHYDL